MTDESMNADGLDPAFEGSDFAGLQSSAYAVAESDVGEDDILAEDLDIG